MIDRGTTPVGAFQRGGGAGHGHRPSVGRRAGERLAHVERDDAVGAAVCDQTDFGRSAPSREDDAIARRGTSNRSARAITPSGARRRHRAARAHARSFSRPSPELDARRGSRRLSRPDWRFHDDAPTFSSAVAMIALAAFGGCSFSRF
ncbi:MAG TPA: hypothetical protein VN603_10215, partial [Candidatus Acidoferrales bacterium]|nr:hypothetical protein [Candidatus Acidoferrales bacterium]